MIKLTPEEVVQSLKSIARKKAQEQLNTDLELIDSVVKPLLDQGLVQMSETSKDYFVVRKQAQDRANETGRDQGLELNRLTKEYRTFALPAAKSRQGFELRCEVVHPERRENTAPGHGYEATMAQPSGWHGAQR